MIPSTSVLRSCGQGPLVPDLASPQPSSVAAPTRFLPTASCSVGWSGTWVRRLYTETFPHSRIGKGRGGGSVYGRRQSGQDLYGTHTRGNGCLTGTSTSTGTTRAPQTESTSSLVPREAPDENVCASPPAPPPPLASPLSLVRNESYWPGDSGAHRTHSSGQARPRHARGTSCTPLARRVTPPRGPGDNPPREHAQRRAQRRAQRDAPAEATWCSRRRGV